MNNYKDTNGVWFELVTVKDYAGNVISKTSLKQWIGAGQKNKGRWFSWLCEWNRKRRKVSSWMYVSRRSLLFTYGDIAASTKQTFSPLRNQQSIFKAMDRRSRCVFWFVGHVSDKRVARKTPPFIRNQQSISTMFNTTRNRTWTTG